MFFCRTFLYTLFPKTWFHHIPFRQTGISKTQPDLKLKIFTALKSSPNLSYKIILIFRKYRPCQKPQQIQLLSGFFQNYLNCAPPVCYRCADIIEHVRKQFISIDMLISCQLSGPGGTQHLFQHGILSAVQSDLTNFHSEFLLNKFQSFF